VAYEHHGQQIMESDLFPGSFQTLQPRLAEVQQQVFRV